MLRVGAFLTPGSPKGRTWFFNVVQTAHGVVQVPGGRLCSTAIVIQAFRNPLLYAILKDLPARQSEEPLVPKARIAICFQNDIEQGCVRVLTGELR